MSWKNLYPYVRMLTNICAIFFYTMFATNFILRISSGDNSIGFWTIFSFVSLTAVTVYNHFDVKNEVEILNGTKIELSSAPGGRLFQIFGFAASKKSFEAIYVPIIYDMREEYFEALSENRIWKARWVRIRGTWSFVVAIGLDRAFAFVSFFIKAWKSVN